MKLNKHYKDNPNEKVDYSTMSDIEFYKKLIKWYLFDALKKNHYQDAAFYNETTERFTKRKHLASLISNEFQLHLHNGSTILERAAGTGIVTKELIKNFDVTAGDISEMQINELKKVIDEKQIIIDNINSPIPFENNSFDGIVQVCANRYFTHEGWQQHIKESERVLKEGGVIIVPLFFFHWIYTIITRRRWISHSLTNISELKKNGFTIKKVKPFIGGKFGITSGLMIVAQKKTTPSSDTQHPPEDSPQIQSD